MAELVSCNSIPSFFSQSASSAFDHPDGINSSAIISCAYRCNLILIPSLISDLFSM